MEQEVISILEKERKQVWRKFLFKQHWLLNSIIALSVVAICYQFAKLVFPNWFVNMNYIEPYYGHSKEDIYKGIVQQISRQAPIWIFITSFFLLSMFFIKWVFYRVQFFTERHAVNYYKNLQHKIISPILSNYSEEKSPLPFDKFKNSEITGPNRDAIILEHNKQQMYFGSNHYSRYAGDLLVQFGNVTSKGPFKSKGQEHIGLTFSGMVIMATINSDSFESGRLKLLHDKTGRLFGQLFQKRKFRDDTLIDLKDAAFEKKFKVYASSEDYANNMLTDEFRSLLLKWKAEFDAKLLVTIMDGTVAISLPNWSRMMYPKMYKKLFIKDLEVQLKTFEIFVTELETLFQRNKSIQGYAV